jgi:predicted RNA-binding Zn-ribbon protein involved in translation (DUF1610 family)
MWGGRRMKESMTDKSTQIAVSLEREGQTHECWSCGDMRAAHFCGSCGKVQAPVPEQLLHVLWNARASSTSTWRSSSATSIR